MATGLAGEFANSTGNYSFALNDLGDVHAAQGDMPAALIAFRAEKNVNYTSDNQCIKYCQLYPTNIRLI